MTLTRYRFIFWGFDVHTPTVEQFTVRKSEKGKVWIEDPHPPFGSSQRTFHNHLPGFETEAEAWAGAYAAVNKRHEEAREAYERTMDLLADWDAVVAGRFEKEATS